MADSLARLGFQVIGKYDADQKTMEDAIRDFRQRLTKGGIGLFYFAGHGMQVKGRNYLIPVGAKIEDETEVKYEAVNAGRVLDAMEAAGNNLNLVILDACRDNPWARKWRSASRGFTSMSAPRGTLILYATRPGDLAHDGDGRNSPFTKHLMTGMQKPGVELMDLIRSVTTGVERDTGGKQSPWFEGITREKFYFRPGAADGTQAAGGGAEQVPSSGQAGPAADQVQTQGKDRPTAAKAPIQSEPEKLPEPASEREPEEPPASEIPADSGKALKRAEAELAGGRTDSAEKLVEAVLARHDDKRPDALAMKIRLQLQRGDLKAAENTEDVLTISYPRHPAAKEGAERVYEYYLDEMRGLEPLERAERLEDYLERRRGGLFAPRAVEELEKIHADATERFRRMFDETLRLAEGLIHRERFERARQQLDKAEEISMEAQSHYGIELDEERMEHLRDLLEGGPEAVAERPDYERAFEEHLARAREFADRGLFDRAREEIEKAEQTAREAMSRQGMELGEERIARLWFRIEEMEEQHRAVQFQKYVNEAERLFEAGETEDARTLLERAREYADPRQMARIDLLESSYTDFSTVRRGWIGVTIQEVTPQMATSLGLGSATGVLTMGVVPDGPAGRAGLRLGDVVFRIDGREVDAAYDLVTTVASAKPGTQLEMEIIRNRNRRVLPVTVGVMPDREDFAPMQQRQGDQWGLMLRNLTPDIVRRFNLNRGEEGVLVVGVEPGSPADEAGIRRGDLITEVNRRSVRNMSDHYGAVARAGGGGPIVLLVQRGGRSSFMVLRASQ
jgi:tetratricopeptide (TPR) repeat protein